jgi:8-oxo-dGTP pyrophosphatase MutT (NUDIX family)
MAYCSALPGEPDEEETMPDAPIEAAVLVPLLAAGDDPSLVFIVRTDFGPHAGEVAFPGGQRAPEDASFEETALREFEEELGVSRDAVTLLHTLSPTRTITTGFRVTPVLGRLDRLPAWRPDPREVARVLTVPLRALRDEANRTAVDWSGTAYPGIRAGAHVIWGLTFRILERISPLLPGAPDGPGAPPDPPEGRG